MKILLYPFLNRLKRRGRNCDLSRPCPWMFTWESMCSTPGTASSNSPVKSRHSAPYKKCRSKSYRVDKGSPSYSGTSFLGARERYMYEWWRIWLIMWQMWGDLRSLLTLCARASCSCSQSQFRGWKWLKKSSNIGNSNLKPLSRNNLKSNPNSTRKTCISRSTTHDRNQKGQKQKS